MKTILETDRLILREFVYEDGKKLSSLMADKDFMNFSVWGPVDIEGTKDFLKKALRDYKNNGFGIWAVIHKDSNKLIGSCGLYIADIGNGQKAIETSYRLEKAFRGKGLAIESVVAVRDYAFSGLNLDEIVACVDAQNVPSIRVAEKVGMKYWKLGTLFGVHCCVYRITRDEWIDI